MIILFEGFVMKEKKQKRAGVRVKTRIRAGSLVQGGWSGGGPGGGDPQ